MGGAREMAPNGRLKSHERRYAASAAAAAHLTLISERDLPRSFVRSAATSKAAADAQNAKHDVFPSKLDPREGWASELRTLFYVSNEVWHCSARSKHLLRRNGNPECC